jgi:5'-3' exonuclease
LANFISPLRDTVVGPAPRAKLNEQRKRRFDPSRSRTEGNEAAQFDLLKITPGTQFMLELSDRIKKSVEAKRQEDENWKHLDVVFSGPDVEGEAEHKLMDYMRAKPDNLKWMKSHTHCFFGNDADLALLALVTHAERFDIVRKFTPRSRMYTSVAKDATATSTSDDAAALSSSTETPAAAAEEAEPVAPETTGAEGGNEEGNEEAPADGEGDEATEDKEDARPKYIFERMPVTSLRGIMAAEMGKRDDLQKKMQSDPNILERAIDDFIVYAQRSQARSEGGRTQRFNFCV